MPLRPPGRYRRLGRLASIVISAAPFPAVAADLALSPWGTYLFFAIVASVVIVLLLHEALDHEHADARHRDERLRQATMKTPSAKVRFGPKPVARDDVERRGASIPAVDS